MLEPQGSCLDGDVGGVLAMTLPRPIAVPRRMLVRPFSSVSVSSVSGWQALGRAPDLDYPGRFYCCLKTDGELWTIQVQLLEDQRASWQ